MNRPLYLTAILGVTITAVPASAQQSLGPQTPEQRAARFDAADADKDARLDKVEFEAMLPERARPRADQMWQRLDNDGDGFVSKESFLNMRRPRQNSAPRS